MKNRLFNAIAAVSVISVGLSCPCSAITVPDFNSDGISIGVDDDFVPETSAGIKGIDVGDFDLSVSKTDDYVPETSAGIKGLDVDDFDLSDSLVDDFVPETSAGIYIPDFKSLDDFIPEIPEIEIDMRDPTDVPGGLTEQRVADIYTFTLDGVTCQMPCDFRRLIEAGWQTPSGNPDELYMQPMTYTNLQIEKGTSKLNIQVMNATPDYAAVSDSKICAITVTKDSNVSFATKDGIRIGSTTEDLHALYGENVFHEGECSDGRYLMWTLFYDYLYERQGIDAQFITRRSTSDNFYVIFENNAATEIDLENFVF